MKQIHVIPMLFVSLILVSHALLFSAPVVKPDGPTTPSPPAPVIPAQVTATQANKPAEIKPAENKPDAMKPEDITSEDITFEAISSEDISSEDLDWDGYRPEPPVVPPLDRRSGIKSGPKKSPGSGRGIGPTSYKRDGNVGRGSSDRGPSDRGPDGFRSVFSGENVDHRPEMGPPDRDFPNIPPPRGLFRNWEKLQQVDPEMYELLVKDSELESLTRMLTMQFHQAEGDAKENLGRELDETVKSHFEVRQKRRSLELFRLGEELKRMQDLFEKREKAAQQIILQRQQELKGQTESLF